MLVPRWSHSTICAFLVAVGSFARPAALLPKPATTDDLLINLKTALDDDRLFDDAFYTETNLQQFFGGTELIKSYVEEGKPKPFTRFFINGLSAMVPPMPLGGGHGTLQGLRAEISKVTSDGQEHGKIISVRGFFEIHSEDDHLEAKYVMNKLVYPWTEDQKAEDETFMAIAREPLRNPLIFFCPDIA